jgi:hypothetical protein
MGRLKEAAHGSLFCEAMGRDLSMAFFNSIRPVPAYKAELAGSASGQARP